MMTLTKHDYAIEIAVLRSLVEHEALRYPTGHKFTPLDMAKMTAKICTLRPDLIQRISEDWDDTDLYPTRPMVLIHPGDDHTPTFWLLGWRPCEGTDIHDHGDSQAGICVAKGVVAEDVFVEAGRGIEDGAEVVHVKKASTRHLLQGSTIAIAAPYIHTVRGECSETEFAITLHAYYPPLREMGFFEETGNPETLVQTGHWQDDTAK